ncbi:SDR family NAD(P)-dependent oxidoreductase [Rhodopirellula sp. SWK7]|uniref:SDR family NAD(P)-dependent oxidoreductase n=1 Tax=Rhodopirellula sp. SWK7 TaxID=595460 RepID=UPI0002BFA022|nr:SDR family oxidoreductase [Rhodopirellula sp. SWK7]EMI45238.1 3-oxoacyl-(acyl-carrier protein) reductase [Rhodopirellula sp. SWK7]
MLASSAATADLMTGIVVTGGSSGIGRAIAIRLAQDVARQGFEGSAQVLVHYRRNRKGALETADEIKRLGVECDVMAADLSKPDDVHRFADDAIERLGVISTWVNNAGVDVLTGEAASWSFDQKLRMLLDVDVCGTIALSRIVGPAMAEQATSREVAPSMIFIGWDQAPEGMEGDAGMMFGPVKAAVMAFANSLTQTLAPRVRVNTVAPGWIQTAWGETTSPYWNARAQNQSLMQRWGRPEDIAEAVAYLASPNAGFITGQTINVNGGWNRKFEGQHDG